MNEAIAIIGNLVLIVILVGMLAAVLWKRWHEI